MPAISPRAPNFDLFADRLAFPPKRVTTFNASPGHEPQWGTTPQNWTQHHSHMCSSWGNAPHVSSMIAAIQNMHTCNIALHVPADVQVKGNDGLKDKTHPGITPSRNPESTHLLTPKLPIVACLRYNSHARRSWELVLKASGQWTIQQRCVARSLGRCEGHLGHYFAFCFSFCLLRGGRGTPKEHVQQCWANY